MTQNFLLFIVGDDLFKILLFVSSISHGRYLCVVVVVVVVKKNVLRKKNIPPSLYESMLGIGHFQRFLFLFSK